MGKFKINFQLLNLGILIPALITVAGWFFGSYLNSERERKAKLREIKISYLIDAYRKLANSTKRNSKATSYYRDLESAFSDIQLFGTDKQIEELRSSIIHGKDGVIDKIMLDDILNDLRNSLRKEIELDSVSGNVFWLRLDDSTYAR